MSRCPARRRRICRAYADGGLSDIDYGWRLAEVDRGRQQAQAASPSANEEAANLFSDIPILWRDATPEDKRLLIERVYVDMGEKRIWAIVQSPGFRELLCHAVAKAPGALVRVVSAEPVQSGTDSMFGVGGD